MNVSDKCIVLLTFYVVNKMLLHPLYVSRMQLLLNAISPAKSSTPPEQRLSVLNGAILKVKRYIGTILGHSISYRRRPVVTASSTPFAIAESPDHAVADSTPPRRPHSPANVTQSRSRRSTERHLTRARPRKDQSWN